MHSCPSLIPPTVAVRRRQTKAVANLLNLHLLLDPDWIDWALDNYLGTPTTSAFIAWFKATGGPNGQGIGGLLNDPYFPPEMTAPHGSFESFVRGWAARFRSEGLCWQDEQDRRNDIRQTLHERWECYDAGVVLWAAVARNHPDSLSSKLARRERALRKHLVSLDENEDPNCCSPREWEDCAAVVSWQSVAKDESVQQFTKNLANPSLTSVLQNPSRRALLAYFLNTPGAAVGAYAAQTGRDKTQVSAELRQVLRALVGPQYTKLLRHMRADRFLAALPPSAHDSLAQLVHPKLPRSVIQNLAHGCSHASPP